MGKKKTKVEPWKPAQPYIIKGMEQTSKTFDDNQPRLQDMSNEAYDAFKSISPEAFQASPFVKSAQGTAQALGGGALLGTNPGQNTYDRMQGRQPTAMPSGFGGGNPGRDPSMGVIGRMAAGGEVNPGDAFASNVAGGGYLNAQPSAGMYGQMMDQSYSTANPFVDDMIRQTGDDVTKRANQLFSSRGMGSGIGSAFSDVLSKNLANSGNQIRYQNYNDAEARRLQAGGQSDAAFSAERGRMDGMTGLLSDNFNQGQNRMLSAGQALGGRFDAGQDRALARYSGDQDRGLARYSGDQDRALDAARASDAAQQSQVQQMLTALGLTGELRGAEFAGIGPALGLLNTAADIPYVGTAALNGQIRTASNGYNTTTQSGGLGQALLGAGAQLGSAYLGRPGQ